MTRPIIVVSSSYFGEGERDCDDVIENTHKRFPEAGCPPKDKFVRRVETCFTSCLPIDLEPLGEISNPVFSPTSSGTTTASALRIPDVLPFLVRGQYNCRRSLLISRQTRLTLRIIVS